MHSAVSPASATRARAMSATLWAVAALSLGAAWVHFAYMDSHFREWWAYGAFFLAVGLGQALFAVLVLVRPQRWLLLTGIAGNSAIIGMYVVSRTEGPPLGPHARVLEPAGAVDLATTGAEVVLVGLLVTLLGGATRRLAVNALLAFGVVLWVLRLTDHLA